jgi:hypothetical protein
MAIAYSGLARVLVPDKRRFMREENLHAQKSSTVSGHVAACERQRPIAPVARFRKA